MMKSSAFRNPERRASFAAVAAVAVVVATLGADWARAQTREVTATAASAGAREAAVERVAAEPYANRFPNLVLKTHEGKNVRFYDDLLKGKIVLINFMYATCKER